MSQPNTLSLSSLWLLMTAQVAAVIPHISRVPVVISLLYCACCFWRILIFRKHWAFPQRGITAVLLLLGIGGILIHYRSIIGLTPNAALLVLGLALKLLEMRTKRDAYVVIMLCFVIVIVAFLYTQTISITLYMIGVIVISTSALISLNQPPAVHQPFCNIKLALILLGQSIPLMVILFFLFPRIAPMWWIQIDAATSRTGISDSMSPGDIANVSRSAALAFRASFDDEIPDNKLLYWRGLVYSHFDGKTWSLGDLAGKTVDSQIQWHHSSHPWDQEIQRIGGLTRYSIILEPSNRPWLFALATPLALTPNIGLTRDYRLVAKKPVRQLLQYRVQSFLQHRTGTPLADWIRRATTQLPEKGNPRARQLAELWRSQAANDLAFIQQILAYFNTQSFYYTLRPPLLGENGVDEFLLDTRKGFCEHYAGSFAFLVRAAGIPARVVAGYQGGEINPFGNYVLVYQFDAHAWVEVWLPGTGWRRFDPTAAVAPERVESGLEEALSQEGSFLESATFSLLRYRKTSWLNQFRLGIDAVNYSWHKWVLGYTPKAQVQLLRPLLGAVTSGKLILALTFAFAVMIGIIALFLFWPHRNVERDAVFSLYRKFCKKLAFAGIPRQPGEAPGDYANRVQKLAPEFAPTTVAITTWLLRLRYQPTDGRMSDAANEKIGLAEIRLLIKHMPKRQRKIV